MFSPCTSDYREILAPVTVGITHSRYIPDKSTLSMASVLFKSLFMLFDLKRAPKLKLLSLPRTALSMLQEHLFASAALNKQKRTAAIHTKNTKNKPLFKIQLLRFEMELGNTRLCCLSTAFLCLFFSP